MDARTQTNALATCDACRKGAVAEYRQKGM